MRTLGWSTMRARALGVAVVVASGGTAHAAGFAIAEQSTVAAATGGAGTARDDDAGAAWYNPAALADGGGLRVGVGLVLAAPSVRAAGEGMAGEWEATSSPGVSPLPSLHASWARGRLVFGLAAGVPFGGNVRWPRGWEGADEIVASKLEVVRIAPFVGWAVGGFRLAAGPHVDLARMTLERGLDFVDTDGDVAITMEGVGVGLHLAAWRQLGAVDVGLTYKSRTSIDLDGDADFTAPPAFDTRLMDQGAHSSITLPDRVAVGARWTRGALALLGDLELTAWSVNQELIVAFDRADTPRARQVNDWQTTLAVRAGAEWTRGRWVGRAGGFFDPTPTRGGTRAPSSPDSSRVGATLGGSAGLGRGLIVDASYGYTHLLGSENTGTESLAASYAGRAHMFGLALRWTR